MPGGLQNEPSLSRDPKKLDESVFSKIDVLSGERLAVYSGVVQLKAAAIDIRAVIVHQLDEHNQVKSFKIYMSTDPEQSAEWIMLAYSGRYQQEFIFRDAKQFTGLEQGQARNWPKIDFHVNASMTVVNLAKVAHHISIPVGQRGAFSMSDITNAYANERLALRIFSKCGIDPNLPKMKKVMDEVRNYAARAA